jgi:hypothetical protein
MHAQMMDAAPRQITKATCETDVDCSDGFCDSDGRCRSIEPASGLGTECTLPPDELPPETKAKLRTCSAYRCTDGRCRSCTSDEQCQAGVDPVVLRITCGEVAGMSGKRCGDYSSRP